MKTIGEKPFAKDADGRLLSRIGTVFLRTPGLVTARAAHALQRIMWIDCLNEERAAAGLPPMSEEEENAEIENSVDLIFTDSLVLIRPDPDRMDLAVTTYLPHLKLLGEETTVVGLSGTSFVYDSLYNARIADGLISDIGSDAAPDYERIISLAPDVVLAYGIAGGDNSYIHKLRALGVKVLVINDYLENHPLGRLEYIKLFGALTDKKSLADSIFSSRSQEYIKVKESCAEHISKSVKVLINMPFKDVWYVPGSENYTSLLIADAGGAILGCVKGETVSSQESFEKMYTLGKEADVWINLNNFSTISGVVNENPLYKNLQVVKEEKLFNNIKRSTKFGGSDFWEGGAVEPAEILKDLITIFHPDVAHSEFGERPMKYYLQLNHAEGL